jgi:IS5 family transposase
LGTEPLLYKNKTSLGGRPNIDIVIMIKMLVLQHWFSLSDPELEWQVADRISFRIFLDTTEVVPDFSTVWLFRERLIKSGRFEDLWRELQRQIDEKGFIVKRALFRTRPFITSDPGQKKKKKDQESECKKEDQDLEAIRTNQVQEFDKGLLDISIGDCKRSAPL